MITGSQSVQGKLWSKYARDWAMIQETAGRKSYEYVLRHLPLLHDSTLLDTGCGAGLFCSMAETTGCTVTGIDASDALIKIARSRVPAARFLVGEMESLPFENRSFNVVTGFNSFQYTGNAEYAIAEAKRVLTDDGQLIIVIWGNKEDCEAVSYLDALNSFLPPALPGVPDAFALSENNRLEAILESVGLTISCKMDVPFVWAYPNGLIALRGLLSSGTAAMAIEHSSYEKVKHAVIASMQPHIQAEGAIIYNNTFRVVVATKQ